jgi:RNA polymerase sigma-70 factor (ECF subfamily)
MQRLFDHRILPPTETALALKLVTQMELLKLKTIARLHARGLPADVGWDDLLQEALTRVLTGSRRVPDGVPIVAFLAGIMRSLRSEHWRRIGGGTARAGSRRIRVSRPVDESREATLRDEAADPERMLIATQELKAIEQLFADDRVVLGIICALGEGLSAEQICVSLGLSRTEYESARKRMRRCLLREGLTCAK